MGRTKFINDLRVKNYHEFYLEFLRLLNKANIYGSLDCVGILPVSNLFLGKITKPLKLA